MTLGREVRFPLRRRIGASALANPPPPGSSGAYDAYLPLVRYEQQPGFGLAVRKEVLRRRGAIASARTRAPGPALTRADQDELTRLITRLERALARLAA